ncbi:MAG: hypothetical protein ABIO72_02360 [Patescibacteria group bacterium]
MTIDKDFKKLVRARMEKTRESFTAARAQLHRQQSTDEELCVYGLAPDGRVSARFKPGVTHESSDLAGYGPNERSAERDLFRRISPTFEPANVLTLELRHDAKFWTARATERMDVVGTGPGDWEAEEDLGRKLPPWKPHPRPQNPWRRSRFTHEVRFIEHADGRWSAEDGRDRELIAWGPTRNEAELKLHELQEDRDTRYDSFEDYGNTWDDHD